MNTLKNLINWTEIQKLFPLGQLGTLNKLGVIYTPEIFMLFNFISNNLRKKNKTKTFVPFEIKFVIHSLSFMQGIHVIL